MPVAILQCFRRYRFVGIEINQRQIGVFADLQSALLPNAEPLRDPGARESADLGTRDFVRGVKEQ